jgi:hypothetical protein
MNAVFQELLGCEVGVNKTQQQKKEAAYNSVAGALFNSGLFGGGVTGLR